MISSALQKLSLCLLFGLWAAGASIAQTAPKVTDIGAERPKTAIFIGNSFFYYNNSMHNQVNRLARAVDAQNTLRSISVTISGSGMDWHAVDSYFRPDALGRYSFDEQNNITFNKPTGKLFDIAILMDCSQCPIHPQLKPIFHEQARKTSEVVRKHGATPVFFMSWAYADKPAMTAELAEEYTVAGNANDVLVIPAGLAFARAIGQRPDLNLYADDKRHPSPAGSYLAAATVYSAVFKKSAVGASYTAGLDTATAQFLQKVAWDTVQEYYARTATEARATR
jgi:hypothetical protein